MIFIDFNNLSISKFRKKKPANTCQELHYSEAQWHPLDITDFQVIFDNFLLFFFHSAYASVFYKAHQHFLLFLKVIPYLFTHPLGCLHILALLKLPWKVIYDREIRLYYNQY